MITTGTLTTPPDNAQDDVYKCQLNFAVKVFNKAQVAKSVKIVETLGSLQVIREKFSVADL